MKARIDRILQSLPGGELVRNVLIASSGNIAAIAITLAASPIITRLFEPADFGIFAVFMSLTYVLSVFGTLRYEAAISLPKEDSDALNIALLCVLLSVGVASLIGVLEWIFRDWICHGRPFHLSSRLSSSFS